MRHSNIMKYKLDIKTLTIDVLKEMIFLNTTERPCRLSPVFLTNKQNVSKFYVFFYLFFSTCRRNGIFSTRCGDMSKIVQKTDMKIKRV